MVLDLDTNPTHTLVSRENSVREGGRLIPEIQRISSLIKAPYYTYTDPAEFICVPFDAAIIDQVNDLVRKKQQLNPTILVVIGIGGSCLGTYAVFQAILGSMYNQTVPKLRIFFVETVDAAYTSDVVTIVSKELEKKAVVLVNVISKSGTTLETVSNFEVFLALVKQYHPDTYHDYFVITTDIDSLLWQMGQSKGIDCLPIPKKVGGRYSVFSPVGLFPLSLLGISVDQLQAGAQAITNLCTSTDILNNPAALRALTLYGQYQQGKTIHDMFLFATDLYGLGAWYRQLMGESIGKEHVVTGEQLFIGITPTVSVGSADLHSVAQLYLGGPFDKITTFVSVQKSRSDISFFNTESFKALHMNYLQRSSFSTIMQAIVSGTKNAYRQANRPFMGITLPEVSAYYIGQLMQLCMIEMVYLGYLLGVNPFDQPEVELYKREVHVLLQHSDQ